MSLAHDFRSLLALAVAFAMHGLLLFSCLHLVPWTFAAIQTVTVDDAAIGHPQAHFRFSARRGWTTQANPGLAFPDPRLAHDGTWHDTTHDTNVDIESAFVDVTFIGMSTDSDLSNHLNISGIGIQVFCIVANDLGPGIGNKANYSFTLDGQPSGVFSHIRDPSRPKFEYNTQSMYRHHIGRRNQLDIRQYSTWVACPIRNTHLELG